MVRTTAHTEHDILAGAQSWADPPSRSSRWPPPARLTDVFRKDGSTAQLAKQVENGAGSTSGRGGRYMDAPGKAGKLTASGNSRVVCVIWLRTAWRHPRQTTADLRGWSRGWRSSRNGRSFSTQSVDPWRRHHSRPRRMRFAPCMRFQSFPLSHIHRSNRPLPGISGIPPGSK